MSDAVEDKFATWIDMDVPVELIERSTFQVRSSLEGLDALAESMARRGLINRILLRPMNGRFQLVGGERRWEASLGLGWKTISSRVKRMSDEEALEVAILDNEQRDDTNPIEKARGYELLHNEPYNKSLEEIGKLVGKSKTVIGEFLLMLEQPEQIQRWIISGELSATHAKSLNRVPALDERIGLAEQAVEHDWSTRQTDRSVDKYLKTHRESHHGQQKRASAQASKSGPDTPSKVLEEVIERHSLQPMGGWLRVLLSSSLSSPRKALQFIAGGMVLDVAGNFIGSFKFMGASWVGLVTTGLGSAMVLVGVVQLARYALANSQSLLVTLGEKGSGVAKWVRAFGASVAGSVSKTFRKVHQRVIGRKPDVHRESSSNRGLEPTTPPTGDAPQGHRSELPMEAAELPMKRH